MSSEDDAMNDAAQESDNLAKELKIIQTYTAIIVSIIAVLLAIAIGILISKGAA